MTSKTLNIYALFLKKYEGLLTQTQKQAFRLYFYENLSYAEIAKITATTRTACLWQRA